MTGSTHPINFDRFNFRLKTAGEFIYQIGLEPCGYLHDLRASLVLCSDDPKDSDIVIGTIKGFVADLESASLEGVSIMDVFDTEQTTMDYFEALYSGDDDWDSFLPAVIRAAGCDEWVARNLLILDRLEIEPQYRGHRFSLDAMQMFIERFRMGVGLVALKPFPLQFESSYRGVKNKIKRETDGLDGFSCTNAQGISKLTKLYGTLGFKRVPKTGYMVRDAQRSFN